MIQTAFFIAYALCQLPAGSLVEVVGHRIVLPCAITWTTCMDLGGRFAGTVSGWMNICGNIVGAVVGASID